MATTTTYSLIKPTVGGDENTWGADLNTNFDSIDDLLDGTTAIAPNLTEGSWEVGGVAVTATAAELNILDGVTASTAELNTLDGITASTAELNILDGVTATASELNVLDGVTGLLGQGQTWQTPTRAVDTSYQNTTGRPIMVAISGRSTSTGRFLQVSVDNSTWLIVGTTSASADSSTSGTCFIVPPNWYYRTSGGAIDFLQWHELR